MDYIILHATAVNADDAIKMVTREVQKHVSSGWKPLGGVSVSRTDCETMYIHTQKVVVAQAMIKE